MQQENNMSVVEGVELEELTPEKKNGSLGSDHYLDVVKDVEVKLSAYLGETNITVGELFAMKQGEVLKLNKDSQEPIELMLNGRKVACGNLVVVDDNFGIQLTEICEL